MTKPMRVGIIGCGVVGPVHAESFQNIGDVEISWACDLLRDRAEKLADRFGAQRVTTEYDDLLNDPDLDCVAVCTDHASHAAISCAALDKGKHVLCEKALSSTPEGLSAMLSAEKAHPDRVFSGVLQHRFEQVNRAVRDAVQSGVLGTVLTCSARLVCLRTSDYYASDQWRGTWEGEGGSVLINQAIHFVDIMAWIIGGVSSVQASYANRTHPGSIETEDTVVVSLEHSCGALGTVEATSSCEAVPWAPEVSVCGTRGVVVIQENELTRCDLADSEAAERLREEASAPPSEALKCGSGHYGPGHPRQIADFVGAVRDGRRPFVSAADAVHCVDIVLAAYQSHRTERRVGLRLRSATGRVDRSATGGKEKRTGSFPSRTGC